jgi:hypothetical protein
MGQMQRQKRLWNELRGTAPLKALWAGMNRIPLQDFEIAALMAEPPMTIKDLALDIAGRGITIWYDPSDGHIKAKAFKRA